MRTRILMLVAVGVSLATLSGGVAAQRSDPAAQALLRTATDKEVVDGDIKAAITQYQAIADRYGSTDRATAAQALLRTAEAYRKLGNPQAKQTYQKIVAQYADQTAVVTVARARLGPSAPPNARNSDIRPVWSGADVDLRGRVSHDGRYLSGGTTSRPMNLIIRDLVSGQTTTLTTGANDVEYVEHSIFSPDDSKLAYAWLNSNRRYEMRVIDRAGGLPRVLFELPTSAGWMQAFDWSPDGRLIAVQINSEKVQKLALVSAADGSVRVLKEFGSRAPYNLSFSPDGRFIAYDVPPTEGGPSRDIFVAAVDGSRDVHAVSHAANDQLLGWFPDGRRLLMASDRTGTNDVYAIVIEDGRPQGEPLLLKRDVGTVTAAMGFTRSGEFVFGTRPDSGDVQLATLDPAGLVTNGPEPLGGSFTGNRFFGAWSPDGQHLVFLSRVLYQHNQKQLSIYTARSGEVRTIPVALRWFHLDVSWDANSRHVLLPGVDGKGEGGLHHVAVDSGRVDASLTGPPGGAGRDISYPLAMSPDGTTVFLAGGVQGGGLTLIRRELASLRETVIVDTPFVAFALSSDGRQLAVIKRYGPDGKPIGRANVPNATDVIQVVPATGGQPREIFKGARLGTTLAWAPDGRFVYYGQMPAGSVWRVPTTGGEAQELPIKVEGLAHISIHPDGRQLAVSSRTRLQEVLAMGPFTAP